MSDITSFLARQVLADLVANGATLQRQPDQGDGLARAIVDFSPGADRDRCRSIIAASKADGSWPAIVRSLPLTTGGAP